MIFIEFWSYLRSISARFGLMFALKIDQKINSKMECILASFFDWFWSIFGPKLEEKINQKSIKKGERKMTRKRDFGRAAISGGRGLPALKGETPRHPVSVHCSRLKTGRALL